MRRNPFQEDQDTAGEPVLHRDCRQAGGDVTQYASLEMDMPLHEIPMRDRILDALIHSGQDVWISGEKLSAAFGISRAAVSKHMMTLREEGNIIESVPHRGYRMISRADPWAGEDIGAGLHTKCLG